MRPPRINNAEWNRRAFLAAMGGAATLSFAQPFALAAPARNILTRPIPKTGERIPAVGMGSWITFNVGDIPELLAARVAVLREFFAAGGGMIDSSPMYGLSEKVIGYCLKQLPDTRGLFSATKVWTPFRFHGLTQMKNSEALWGEDRFDLMQIHNLLNWESHLETLQQFKAAGRIRYIGVTTSHGSRHEELETIMNDEDIDFVQFTYNIVEREAERRLLPLAAERGLAVIINRPFDGGGLFDAFAAKPLPPWAHEAGAANWAQFFLKFIVTHPAVTCAIPATSKAEHMRENMGALLGPLPDSAMRKRMVDYVGNL